MARVEVVKPYVERLLARFCRTDSLYVDEDGDVPIRRGSAMYWVSLYDQGGEAHVQIWSYLARGVEPSPGLFEFVNRINAEIRYGRVFFRDGDVLVSHEVLADTLDQRELENACESIGSISDHYDDELVGRFGGSVFFSDAAQPRNGP